MTGTDQEVLAEACSDLVGQVAANPSLADAIVSALMSGELAASSGPVGISNVLKGAPGGHHLKRFLKTWHSMAPHLSAADVAAMVKSTLDSYRLAQRRAHIVDAVWTGPHVAGSEVRRTEAVVNEILANAQQELLVVGYWLVTSTVKIKTLVETLKKKANEGVKTRFIFDPGVKKNSPDNFSALNELWPNGLEGYPREVFTWSEHMVKVTTSSGVEYDRKLHAKVIVADRRDALVTSANLTQAAMLENLEMGLRVEGATAGALVRHFDLLIDEGVLERRI